MTSDGRNCAGRWEKMRCQMGEIALQMGEIALLIDAQNGGKMGFLKPNLVENARQMGEIALKNDLQQS